MRRTTIWYNNVWEAGEEYYEAGAIYSSNENKVYVSTAPTESRCLSRFMLGTKHRMRVVRNQDRALTVDQLLLIGDIAEKDWVQSNSDKEKN